MLNYKEDHAASSKELDAVHAYFEKLKPQCETKVLATLLGVRVRKIGKISKI